LGAGLAFVLEGHAHGALPDLCWIPRWCTHGSIL
jgi:hypothetical protein